jgi:hypothetical protein
MDTASSWFLGCAHGARSRGAAREGRALTSGGRWYETLDSAEKTLSSFMLMQERSVTASNAADTMGTWTRPSQNQQPGQAQPADGRRTSTMTTGAMDWPDSSASRKWYRLSRRVPNRFSSSDYPEGQPRHYSATAHLGKRQKLVLLHRGESAARGNGGALGQVLSELLAASQTRT